MDGTGACWCRPNCARRRVLPRTPFCWAWATHFELWDKATYDAQEARAMQGEMPDVFKDFSF